MAEKETFSKQVNDLRRQAEKKAVKITEKLETLSPEDTRLTLHELRVHQIELETQNEELRSSQAELDAARARYFDLYDLAPVGYCTLSEKGLILEANLTAATLLGVFRGALVKQPITRFILKENMDTYYFHRKQLFENGEPHACELRMVKSDGTAFWAHLAVTVARVVDGSLVCRVVMSDITGRKQAESALQKNEQRMRSLVEVTSDWIWEVNKEGIYTYSSQKSRDILGWEPEEIVGKTPFDFMPADEVERTGLLFKERAKAWQPMERIENVNLHRDGRRVILETSAVPFFDEKGALLGYRGIDRDITVRKRAEEAVQESEALLRALLAEKEVLLKEVHHRVKNNLAAIMGLLDLQGQMIVDEPARVALTELSARIRSMALVHEQLYQSEDFSRIDFQDYLEVLIAHLRSSYVRSIDIHISVAAVGVKMGLDCAVPCGLLITELVTNALKYAFPADRPPEADGCEIAVSAGWDGATFTLVVADNGVGLPADLDWTNTKTLGLLLVKMLGQHQLQGRIELDRTGGTTFRLQFAPGAGIRRRMNDEG